MQQRKLGRTGQKLSVVGFGGLVANKEEPAALARIVGEAVNRGVNYFDVAPEYGQAEELLGPALEPYRQKVFLSCKTLERSAEGAARELKRSLARLRTDHFDLYQLHGIGKMEEVKQVLSPGGALETVIKARKDGLVRFIGFSAHSEEAAIALMDGFDFDSLMFPINWVCWHRGHFGPRVLTHAGKKGLGVIALKALAKTRCTDWNKRKWNKCWYEPFDTPAEAELSLRFTLGKPVTVAVSPSHAELLWLECDAAEKFRPLNPEEERELIRRSRVIEPIFKQEAKD